jgi:hypothetical protein
MKMAKKSLKERISDWKMNVSFAKDDAVFWKEELTPMIKKNWGKMLMVIPITICLIWASLVWILKTDEIVTVTGKETKMIEVVREEKDPNTNEIKKVKDKVDVYFVYTDKGAFQYHSSWFFLQIEVADSFGRLQENKTYRLTHYGFRNALFDWYENIVDFVEVEPVTQPDGTVEYVEVKK